MPLVSGWVRTASAYGHGESHDNATLCHVYNSNGQPTSHSISQDRFSGALKPPAAPHANCWPSETRWLRVLSMICAPANPLTTIVVFDRCECLNLFNIS